MKLNATSKYLGSGVVPTYRPTKKQQQEDSVRLLSSKAATNTYLAKRAADKKLQEELEAKRFTWQLSYDNLSKPVIGELLVVTEPVEITDRDDPRTGNRLIYVVMHKIGEFPDKPEWLVVNIPPYNAGGFWCFLNGESSRYYDGFPADRKPLAKTIKLLSYSKSNNSCVCTVLEWE